LVVQTIQRKIYEFWETALQNGGDIKDGQQKQMVRLG
jgi:hypothetical protein